MALFPFFMNIEGKEGLVIGSGKHAQEKMERLEPYKHSRQYGRNFRLFTEGSS